MDNNGGACTEYGALTLLSWCGEVRRPSPTAGNSSRKTPMDPDWSALRCTTNATFSGLRA